MAHTPRPTTAPDQDICAHCNLPIDALKTGFVAVMGKGMYHPGCDEAAQRAEDEARYGY